jgi:hypothetical protein
MQRVQALRKQAADLRALSLGLLHAPLSRAEVINAARECDREADERLLFLGLDSSAPTPKPAT